MSEFHLTTAAARSLHPYFSDIQNKVLHSRVIAEMTRAQLSLFIDAAMSGDGTTSDPIPRQRRKQRRQYSQAHSGRTDNFALACILSGLPVSVTGPDAQGRWTCGVLARDVTQRQGRAWSVFDHTGIVWCPETANGTWLARRNGTVYFTGNSTDVLRSVVDRERLELPWDRDLIGEFQGQTFTIERSALDQYGRRRYNMGKFHALDAARMAILGWRQHAIEEMVKPQESVPVLDAFVSF